MRRHIEARHIEGRPGIAFVSDVKGVIAVRNGAAGIAQQHRPIILTTVGIADGRRVPNGAPTARGRQGSTIAGLRR